jgi:DNA replication protein DnaC
LEKALSSIGLKQLSDEPPISNSEWLIQQLEWEKNRQGNLDWEDNYNCEECKNRGYLPFIDNENETIYYKECKCMKIRKSIKILKASGLEGSIKSIASYQTPEKWQEDIKKKAIEFLKDKEASCFYIGGQSGAGKTHICSGIAREYIYRAKSTRYVMWVEMVEKMKDFRDPERDRYVEDISTADVLYIDDFFKPDINRAGYSRQDIITTFKVIDRRYKAKDKITLISSELLIRELSAIDEAIAGRIIEMTRGIYGIDIAKNAERNYRLKAVM